MKRVNILLAAMALLSPLASVAQAARINMPDFSGLAAKAKESVDIALDKDMLRTAASFMSGAEDPQFAEQVKRLDGVYIKTFEFEKAGQYAMSDIDAMIRQVETSGWKKLMSIRDGEDRVEMWMRQDSHDGGMFFVASEPKELVVINIVGSVDLETLRKLQGRMGVPGLPGFGPPTAPPAPPATPVRPRQ
ncbi:MAG: DUF4252 domain-containing protein [Steroidobacteraceae bacterium]